MKLVWNSHVYALMSITVVIFMKPWNSKIPLGNSAGIDFSQNSFAEDLQHEIFRWLEK